MCCAAYIVSVVGLHCFCLFSHLLVVLVLQAAAFAFVCFSLLVLQCLVCSSRYEFGSLLG